MFPNADDVQATLDLVMQLVVASLGRNSAVLEVAMGSVVVYITFKVAGAKISSTTCCRKEQMCLLLLTTNLVP